MTIPAVTAKMNDVIDSSDLFVYPSNKVNSKAKIYNFMMLGIIIFVCLTEFDGLYSSISMDSGVS